jgi:hypothetical protein
MVPVTGLITQNGSPVEGAVVLFHPVIKGAGIKTSNGETDAEGKFELQSHVKGAEYQSGAQAGDYLVTIEKLDSSQVYTTMSPPKDLLPVQYKSPKSSGLEASVSSSGDKHFEFDLK